MELREEIQLLQAKEQELSARAFHETYLPKKEEIIRERQKLSNQISKLRVELDKETETQALIKLKEMVKEAVENKALILTINGNKQKVKNDLKVELEFQPCHHKKTILLPEFIREYEFRDNKKIPVPNQRLLARWSSTLSTPCVMNATMTCEHCYEQHEQERKAGKRSHGERGRLHWEIQIVK